MSPIFGLRKLYVIIRGIKGSRGSRERNSPRSHGDERKLCSVNREISRGTILADRTERRESEEEERGGGRTKPSQF